MLENTSGRFRLPAVEKDAATTGRRRAFAEWATRPDHPLTARVIVNRVWAHHFGEGIVKTLDNFGRSGARPTNQKLLDWLAREFVRPTAALGVGRSAGQRLTHNAWSLKHLHRLIVTSAAYRQESNYRSAAAKIDPENRLLWRQRPRRLEAEAVRDAMLAAAGNLDATMFGEPVGNETRPTGEIVASGEEKGGRRSIYLLVRRSMPVTVLNTFDMPVMETNCTRRTVSTTATQSLALLNSSFMASQSRHFSKRLIRECPPPGGTGLSVTARMITLGYELAFGRGPTTIELADSVEFVHNQRKIHNAKPPADAAEVAVADFCHALLSANEFMYVD